MEASGQISRRGIVNLAFERFDQVATATGKLAKAKTLRRLRQRPLLAFVRSVGFSLQFARGVGAASRVRPVARKWPGVRFADRTEVTGRAGRWNLHSDL
jgi:hypothetical protein